MIVLSNSAAQTIGVGQSVVFNTVVTKTGCAEHHRGNSSSVQLCANNGIYSLDFTANITNPDGTAPVQIAITSSGDILQETTMISTAAQSAYNNVSAKTFIKTSCCGSDNRISVTNTGTVPLTIAANSALAIKREG